MARERATAGARADKLAGEAWAAGCGDVQAAINWATARGEVAGRPFQAAFRRTMAARDAAPLDVNPPAASVTDPGAEVVPGRVKPTRRPNSPPAKLTDRARRRTTAAEANGQVGHPAEAAVVDLPATGSAIAPAEFIADMKDLRRLVAKYGKKGLADLVSLLGG